MVLVLNTAGLDDVVSVIDLLFLVVIARAHILFVYECTVLSNDNTTPKTP